MDVAITTLGGFAVTIGDARLDGSEWRRRQAAALVKILALAPNRALHREQVMDLLWPDLGVDEAAPRLYKAAHYGRRILGDPLAIVLAGDMVALFPQQDVWVDAVDFEELARAALTNRDLARAARAAAAYRGDFLPEDRYETWSLETRDRLHLLYVDVLRLAGRWETLAVVEPSDEEAHLRLIAEMQRRGDRRSALRQFERLERALRTELGVAPSPEAARVRDDLRRAPNTAPSLPERDSDRQKLTALLDTVESGSGHALFVSGLPGAGKSALLSWLDRTATGRGWRVGAGLAAHVEGVWPYAPVLEALADLCRRHPTLLDGLDDALKSEIEAGLSGREVVWTATGGHQRLFVATAELLHLAAAGNGALLIIDDAHRADEASLRLMHYLARATFSERALIVFAHRPPVPATLDDVRESLLSRGTAVSHELGPLTPDQTLAKLTGLSTSTRQAMTEQQLQACAAAAIVGTTFNTDEFLAVSGLPEQDAYDVLDAAVAQRMFVRTDVGYAFRHRILRESLVAGLPPSRARALHRRAASALQDLDGSPSRIGHHLVEAGDNGAAVAWMLRAAEASAALGANREALATLDSVRRQARGPDLARLLSLRADLFMAAGDSGAIDAYREALATVAEPSARTRLRARLARAATFTGDLETAAVALDGLMVDGSSSDIDLLLARGNLALFRGDLDAAEAAAAQARRDVTFSRPDDWQTFDLITLQGLIAHNRGEWFSRLRLELKSGATRPALAARIFDSHLCVAEYLLYGPTPYPEVLELADALQHTAERSGVLRAVAFATALRGETALLMGDLAIADRELRDAADLHHDIDSAAGEAHSLQRLAEVKLALGDRMQTTRLLSRALTLARFTSIAKHVLQRVYGTMIAAAETPSAARAMVDQAAAALGTDDQCPFCAIMLAVPAARACADVGDLVDAKRWLTIAETSAQMWEGTAWQASILETRAALAAAEGDPDTAGQLRRSAAELFEISGQPLDALRCRSA